MKHSLKILSLLALCNTAFANTDVYGTIGVYMLAAKAEDDTALNATTATVALGGESSSFFVEASLSAPISSSTSGGKTATLKVEDVNLVPNDSNGEPDLSTDSVTNNFNNAGANTVQYDSASASYSTQTGTLKTGQALSLAVTSAAADSNGETKTHSQSVNVTLVPNADPINANSATLTAKAGVYLLSGPNDGADLGIFIEGGTPIFATGDGDGTFEAHVGARFTTDNVFAEAAFGILSDAESSDGTSLVNDQLKLGLGYKFDFKE
jgi:hypothetical protein